jgi:hypothetical protein
VLTPQLDEWAALRGTVRDRRAGVTWMMQLTDVEVALEGGDGPVVTVGSAG